MKKRQHKKYIRKNLFGTEGRQYKCLAIWSDGKYYYEKYETRSGIPETTKTKLNPGKLRTIPIREVLFDEIDGYPREETP